MEVNIRKILSTVKFSTSLGLWNYLCKIAGKSICLIIGSSSLFKFYKNSNKIFVSVLRKGSLKVYLPYNYYKEISHNFYLRLWMREGAGYFCFGRCPGTSQNGLESNENE